MSEVFIDDFRSGWVVVTGASRGIGEAIARVLWKSGFGVFLWARNSERLESVARNISPDGSRIIWSAVDVGDRDQVQAAVDSIPDGIGVVGLVLNAGHGRWQAIPQVKHDDWIQCLEVNLTGAFVTLQALLPLFDFSRFPVVVGVLSDSVVSTFENRSAYASAKAGLEKLLKTFRREYRAQGARVCLLYPSRVDTFFSGSHETANPGMRPNSLSAEQVAEVVSWIFQVPGTVEIRSVHMSSIKTSFGLEEECYVDGN